MQEHNEPMSDPTVTMRIAKPALTKSERAKLELRLGDHESIAAFFVFAVKMAKAGKIADEAVLPETGGEPRPQTMVRLPSDLLEWVRGRARSQGVPVSRYLVALALLFPETPRTKRKKRVCRNRPITSARGKVELKLVHIAQLLFQLQSAFHETYEVVPATEMVLILGNIAETAEKIGAGEIPVSDLEQNTHGQGGLV